MKRLFLVLAAAALPASFLIVAAARAGDPTGRLIIGPGPQAGPVVPSDSWTSLHEKLGPAIVETEFPLGEGDTVPGAHLFPDDPAKSALLQWTNPQTKTGVQSLLISGNRSAWATPHGITLGSSLEEVERINGKPFKLAGFGWDYSGTTLSWEGGALARAVSNGVLNLAFTPDDDAAAYAQTGEDSVLGDGEFASNSRGMRKAQPRVTSITVSF